MGLRDPRVATGRAVERDVDVGAVVGHREDRLVVPADVAIDRHGSGPGLSVVRRLREHDVVAVHPRRVYGPGVRHDLDLGIELPVHSSAGAQVLVGSPGGAAVRRDLQDVIRQRALVPAGGRARVSGRQEVHVRRVRIRRDRRLPIVRRRTDHPLAGPAARRCGGSRLHGERAARFRRPPGVESLLRQLRLLLRLGASAFRTLPLGGGSTPGRGLAGRGRGAAADRQEPGDHDGDDGRHDRDDGQATTLHGNLLRGDVRGTVRPPTPARN